MHHATSGDCCLLSGDKYGPIGHQAILKGAAKQIAIKRAFALQGYHTGLEK